MTPRACGWRGRPRRAGASVTHEHPRGVVTVTVRVRARPVVEGLPAVPLAAQARVAKEPGGDW